jgi:hypothetical protein
MNGGVQSAALPPEHTMMRNVLGILALAASASIAAAQQPATHGDSVSAKAKRHTTTSTSRGEVARSHGMAVRAVARDWVRSDDTRGDDLYRREQMMDRKCGKNRERCGKP